MNDMGVKCEGRVARLKVEVDGGGSDDENSPGDGPGEAGGKVDHGAGVEGVDGGHPHQAAPCLVEACGGRGSRGVSPTYLEA